MDKPAPPPPLRATIFDLLFFPFALLLEHPAPVLLVTVLVGFGGYLIYLRTNIDWFGLINSPMPKMQFSPAYDTITYADEYVWKISYESNSDTRFEGLVRQVVPNRISHLALMTHDVMIATGDYEDPEKVSAQIIDHFMVFKYQSPDLSGSINLLHCVPASDEIYRQLLRVGPNERVIITGREIERIDISDPAGHNLGFAKDAGCRTTLVTSVEFIQNR